MNGDCRTCGHSIGYHQAGSVQEILFTVKGCVCPGFDSEVLPRGARISAAGLEAVDGTIEHRSSGKPPVSEVKPWNELKGALAGTAVGLIIWWSTYVSGAGLFQNPKLILFPAVVGMMIVTMRNGRNKVGAWDPRNREPQP